MDVDKVPPFEGETKQVKVVVVPKAFEASENTVSVDT